MVTTPDPNTDGSVGVLFIMSKPKTQDRPAEKLEKPDEDPENEGRTMLDKALDRMKEKIHLQRLVLIAQLPNGLKDRTELQAHYEKLSLRLGQRFPWDNMTGLLLLYPSCLLHVVESSRDVLVAILKDVIELQQKPDSVLLEAVKIVFIAHDPPSRLFQQWSYKLLNSEVSLDTRRNDTAEGPIETQVVQFLSSVETTAKQLEQAKRGGALPKNLDISPELLVSMSARTELPTPQQHFALYSRRSYRSMTFEYISPSISVTTA